ncbi:MAG: hypothetical protein ACK5T0_10640, partial [Vampirovibrionales bacterium]
MNMISRYNPEYDAKPWLNQKAAPKPAGAIDVPSTAVMPRYWTPDTADQWEPTGFSNGWQRKPQAGTPQLPGFRTPGSHIYDGYGNIIERWEDRTPQLPGFRTPGSQNGGCRPRYDQPVTLAFPENGGGGGVTLAFPENGGGDIGLPIVGGSGPITTQAIPENGGGDVITLAFPENGGGGAVTLAIPENGGGTVTTQALNENGGGTVTTQALNENGGGAVTLAIPENGGGTVTTQALN